MTLCFIGKEKSESNIKLLEEAKKNFRSVFFVPLDGIGVGLNTEFSISYRTSDLQRFKAVFPRIPMSYAPYAYQLLSLFPSETFMPIKPISFLLAQERFFLLTVLRKRGVPTLDLHMARSATAASRFMDTLEFPFIIRTTGKKTGVVVKNKLESKTVMDALAHLNEPILLEDLVKDMVSVYVSQPKALAAVKKKSEEKDLVFSLGKLKNHKLNIETEQLALEASQAVDAQVVRIDISPSIQKVVNIELNPELIKPSKASGVNLPKNIIEAVHEAYRTHKEKPLIMKFFEDAKSVVRDVLKSRNLI